MAEQNILIIDDDPNISKTLSDILKIKGYGTFIVSNGMDGIDFLKQTPMNLVIIDLGLPDMSGLEVLERVKLGNPYTEAIILTGNASLDSAIEAINKGAFSYFLKPYDIEQLIVNVRRAIEKQNALETIARHNQKLEKMNAQLSVSNKILTNEIQERQRAEKELRFSNILLSMQQEVSIDGILVVDEKARILMCNSRFIRMWNIPPNLVTEKIDDPILHLVAAQIADPQSFLQRVNYLYEHRNETGRDEIVLANGQVFDRYSAPIVGSDEQYYGRVWYFRDMTERKRAEEEKETLITDLRESLSRIKTLSGLLPICSWCKKIRDDAGYWQQLESYIGKHSSAEFSHSICPECLGKHFSDPDLEKP
jgi:DNA-binding response OmpR family regulator